MWKQVNDYSISSSSVALLIKLSASFSLLLNYGHTEYAPPCLQFFVVHLYPLAASTANLI